MGVGVTGEGDGAGGGGAAWGRARAAGARGTAAREPRKRRRGVVMDPPRHESLHHVREPEHQDREGQPLAREARYVNAWGSTTASCLSRVGWWRPVPASPPCAPDCEFSAQSSRRPLALPGHAPLPPPRPPRVDGPAQVQINVPLCEEMPQVLEMEPLA